MNFRYIRHLANAFEDSRMTNSSNSRKAEATTIYIEAVFWNANSSKYVHLCDGTDELY
jgi:hypothetical protein